MVLQCLFPPSVDKAIASLLQESKQLSGVELEVRVNRFENNTIVRGVSAEQYKRWKMRLDTHAPRTVHSIDIVKSKGELRCITCTSSNQPVVYERKVKSSVRPIDFAVVVGYNGSQTINLPIRVAVAQELPITAQDYANCRDVEDKRTRVRTSYFYPSKNNVDLIRIDITEITDDSKQLSYQVEIECMTTIQDVADFYYSLRKGFAALFPIIHTLFTPETFGPYSTLVCKRGHFPVNIQPKHYPLLQNTYYITNKLDGTAYTLFVLSTGILLRNDTDCWFIQTLQSTSTNGQTPRWVDSEFRVEVVLRPNKIFLWLYDVFMINNTVAPALFADRLQLLQSFYEWIKAVLQEPYEIAVKTFVSTSEVGLVVALDKMYNAMSHDTDDGIILQPNVCSESPLKWKIQSKISIDFLFVKHAANADKTMYQLHTVGDSRELEPFVPPSKPGSSSTTPASLTLSNQAKIDNISATNLDKLVLECGWKPSINKFYIQRIRWDKIKPNSTFTARSTFKDMVNERTFEMLKQEISAVVCVTTSTTNADVGVVEVVQIDAKTKQQLFPDADQVFQQRITNKGLYSIAKPKHAAQITRYIQDFYPDCKHILDAFAGCGGNTFHFMKTFETVVTVERDHTTCQVLVGNVSLYKSIYSAKVIPINASAVDVIEKWEIANKHIPNVDIVYMDPPWGGVDCAKQQHAIYWVDKTLLTDLVKKCFAFVSVVVLRLGKNIDLQACLLSFSASHDTDVQDLGYAWLVFVSKKGFGFKKMRLVHNQLKSTMISTWCSGKSVLDFGSGKGGDIHKYTAAGVTKLTCVEPNQGHLDVFRQRLSVSTKTMQNVQLVCSPAEQFKGDIHDVVCMFFVLTFFFASEDLLRQLIETICQHLRKDGGVFVCTCMVGTPIRKQLPYNSEHLMIRCVDGESNAIEIDMKHTQTAVLQKEYLVDIHTLFRVCAEAGLYLYQTYDTSNEIATLSADEQFISSATVGLIFQYNTMSRCTVPSHIGVGYRVPCISCAEWSLMSALLDYHDGYSRQGCLYFLQDNIKYVVGVQEENVAKWHEECERMWEFIKQQFTMDVYIRSIKVEQDAETIYTRFLVLAQKWHDKLFDLDAICVLSSILLHIEFCVLDVDTMKWHTYCHTDCTSSVRMTLCYFHPNVFELVV